MLPLPGGHGGEATPAGGDGEVVVRVRNLKVWFAQRAGVLKELLASGGKWVRAVDGVDFDVRRGEVFCLVGESGCGKTTTGKAILRLVDATDGDIFLEMPSEEYARYEALSAAHAKGESQGEALRELRRKYSLTYSEHKPWTRMQYLVVILTVAGASLAGFLGLGALLGFFTDPYSSIGEIYAYSWGVAALVGALGALPPSRPSKRTALSLAILSFVGWFLAPIPSFAIQGLSNPAFANVSAATAIGLAWGANTFFLILAGICVPVITGATCQGVLVYRMRSSEDTGIRIRGLRRRLQLIFQDPYESLNPKQSVYEIVSEPLRVNRITKTPEETADLVADALGATGLRPPEEFMFRFPHELSGGQRQRVSIAAGLVLQPDFIVADEPVSMLDVSIRTEILELMMELRKTRRLTYLFITHDLGLAWVLADRIAVMYLGRIVEQGTKAEVIRTPKHPYTQALISVVPSPDPRHRAARTILKGERPDPVDIPTGCRFHPRCPMAFEKCGWNADELKDLLTNAPVESLRGRIGAMTVDAPKVLRIRTTNGSAEETAEQLRAAIAGSRDQQLVFRGVAEVSTSEGQITITMHDWTEPELVELSPDNAVACHLVTAPAPEETPMPAAL